MDRKTLALTSYLALMGLLIADLALTIVFPGPSLFLFALGPIFVALGVQVIVFRNEHEALWARFGGPSVTMFAFFGFLFVVLGLYFIFGG